MLTKRFLIGYFLISLLSGVGLAIWRTVLMIRYYDPYNNEYAPEASNVLQALGLIIFFAFVVLATSSFFMIRREFRTFSVSDHQSSVFTSALLGFVFIAVAVFVTFYLPTVLADGKYPLFKYSRLASYILLFPCAVYFVLNATGNARLAETKKQLSVFPAIWAIVFLVSSYTNPAYNYKDFNHTLCNVAICALILFFFYDSKMAATGQTSTSCFVFSLISITATMVYMLPTFILMAYWELSSCLDHIFEAVLLGALFYTCACAWRLCLSVTVKEPKQDVPKEATPSV